MGRELVDLVDALLPAIGEVIDIKINWMAESRTPVLSTMPPSVASHMGWNGSEQRLMNLTGSLASTTLLVIPTMTPAPLALMVMRRAASRPVPGAEHGTPVFEAADRIVRAARTAIASQNPGAPTTHADQQP